MGVKVLEKYFKTAKYHTDIYCIRSVYFWKNLLKHVVLILQLKSPIELLHKRKGNNHPPVKSMLPIRNDHSSRFFHKVNHATRHSDNQLLNINHEHLKCFRCLQAFEDYPGRGNNIISQTHNSYTHFSHSNLLNSATQRRNDNIVKGAQ